MAFRKIETGIAGLFVLEPEVHGDARGFFLESWTRDGFAALGLDFSFVQDNLSFSRKGTLRGLHFQAPPHAQGKLVSVIRGSVLDVVVDIRRSSATYGRWFGVELTGDNHRMLWVPPGFAHGFQVLSEDCYFSYKCTAGYSKESEGGLQWNDPRLEIQWGLPNPLLSAKDQHYPSFSEFKSPFE